MSPTRDAADSLRDGTTPGRSPDWDRYGFVPVSWWPEALLTLAFVVNTVALMWVSPVVRVDVAVRDFFDGLNWPLLNGPMAVLTYFGRGYPLFVMCCLVAGWAVWRYRTIRPVLLFLAAWVPLLPVYVMKQLFDRVAPHYPVPDRPPYVDAAGAILGSGASPAASFPSGHAVNSIVFFGVVLMLAGHVLPRLVRVLLVSLPPLLVVVSVTSLGWHWLSDAPAGIVLGLLIMRLVARVPWRRLWLPAPLNRLDARLAASG